MAQAPEKKILAKVILLGNMGVGKTTLLNKYVDGPNATSQPATTIGTDFRKKELKIGLTNISLQLWDTAGQEQFSSIGYSFYRGTNCCVLVFDLSSKESFESLANWKKEFIEKANPKEPSKFPFVVIGNKTDLERQVTEEEARQWCRD